MAGVRRVLQAKDTESGMPNCGSHSRCGDFKVIVVVPTFNHADALPMVLRALDQLDQPVLVVDDGSTDSTETIVSEWSAEIAANGCRAVVRHDSNKGKAAAIHTGLEEAQHLEYTHVATIDSDGQHDVRDLIGLLECAAKRPQAIVVGARSPGKRGVPARSRIGRMISNGLVWIESGSKVGDSQSGMRVYPIAATLALAVRASRYGFETEVLVRAGWRSIAVVEHPIQCIYDPPGGRSTHFNVCGDTCAAAGMHMRLLVRSLGPNVAGHEKGSTGTIPRRLAGWFSPRGLGRMARGDAGSRKRFAASIAVGLLIATLPIYGLKTIVSLWLAAQLKLHPLAVVAVSTLSTPPIGLLFIAYAVCVGSLVLGGGWPDLSGMSGETMAQWATAGDLLLEWIVGGVVGGLALGAVAYLVLRIMLVRPSKHSAEH